MCSGLLVPHFDRRARGTFVGLSLSTTKPHLIRAILESMGYSYVPHIPFTFLLSRIVCLRKGIFNTESFKFLT